MRLPTTPAHVGSKVPVPGEALLDAAFCRCLLGILLLRHGGRTITFTQADFDSITGLHVLEGLNPDGHFLIALGQPERKQS
jgi:hypothetical protein